MILQKGVTKLKANRTGSNDSQSKAHLKNLFVRSRNGNADAIAEMLNDLSLIHSSQVFLIKMSSFT